MGATGYTTGLAPSMSLGCGAYAGNITSDNITPLHLINIKRLAYEKARGAGAGAVATPPGEGDLRARVAAFVTARVGSPADPAPTPPAASSGPASGGAGAALDFVCEDDVRRALRENRVLRVAARAVVTPSARDAAAGTKVLEFTEERT
jgi:acetaldehyde dehydrogenase (acetylating)